MRQRASYSTGQWQLKAGESGYRFDNKWLWHVCRHGNIGLLLMQSLAHGSRFVDCCGLLFTCNSQWLFCSLGERPFLLTWGICTDLFLLHLFIYLSCLQALSVSTGLSKCLFFRVQPIKVNVIDVTKAHERVICSWLNIATKHFKQVRGHATQERAPRLQIVNGVCRLSTPLKWKSET